MLLISPGCLTGVERLQISKTIFTRACNYLGKAQVQLVP